MRAERDAENREWALLAKLSTNAAESMTAKKIISFMAQEAKVHPKSIVGESRQAQIVWIRFIAIYAVHALTGLSSTQIGYIFNRDHTSILHALSRAPKIMEDNPRLAQLFQTTWEKFNDKTPGIS